MKLPPLEKVGVSYWLDTGWYKRPKLPGITFLVRARNEERHIETCLRSLEKIQLIPFQLLVVINGGEDATLKIAQRMCSYRADARVVEYPFQLAKAGLETYVTPSASVHSLPWFYQWCLQQCERQYVFKWDADFEMTLELADWLDSSQFRQEGAHRYRIPAVNQDSYRNCEPYLFITDDYPVYRRDWLWEGVRYLKGADRQVVVPDEISIQENSSVKDPKSHHLLPPWWVCSEGRLAERSGLACRYEQLAKKLGPVRAYARASDPLAGPVMEALPPNYEDIPGLEDGVRAIFTPSIQPVASVIVGADTAPVRTVYGPPGKGNGEDFQAEVTFALTSCGRLDLLERTIRSFREATRYRFARYVLIDDSGQTGIGWTLNALYGDLFDIMVNRDRVGQSRSIDRLYGTIDTEFIFHCEEDWEFHNEDRDDFIGQSVDILRSAPSVGQVWIRDPADSGHPRLPERCATPVGTVFQMLDPDWGGWNGFSWNPGLRRLADYQTCGKFSALATDQSAEFRVARHYGERLGYRAAGLLKGYCRHIGWGRHA